MHKRILRLAALVVGMAIGLLGGAPGLIRDAAATVNAPNNTVTYTGNGATTAFATTFSFLQGSDLVVTVAGVTKTLGTHYTVSGTGNATGTVTFTTAPANLAAVVITRTVDYLQGASLKTNRNYDPATVEKAIDKLAMGEQQLQALYTNPPATILPSNVTAKLNGIRFADQFANIQAAITDAGTTGAVLIPSTYVATDTFTNPNAIPIIDLRGGAGAYTGVVSVKAFGPPGDGVGDDGPALAAAIAALPSTGGTVIVPINITVISPLSFSIPNGKPVFIDLQGHKLTLKHTSGAGLTFTTASFFRQPFTLKHGTIAYGGSTAGITGVKLSQVIQARLEDILFSGFTGTNQVAIQLDNTQDSTLDGVNFVNNTGTGTVCLDLTNNANANAYHNVQFQSCYQAVRIGNGASGNWFSDCLVQSTTGPNAVTVKSLTADANNSILNTVFERCWFENNGDGTANSTAVSFTADTGRTIAGTAFIQCHFNGNTTGTLGVLFRFAGTGNSGGFNIVRIGNRYQGVASVFAGNGSGTGGTSIMDNDTTGTNVAQVDLTGANNGITFGPQGAAKKFQLYGGFLNDNDGRLVFRDVTGAPVELLRYGGTWVFSKDINMNARLTVSHVVLTYGATIATDASLGDSFSITATNGTAFTINTPTSRSTGQRLRYLIRNASGGALGAITWGAAFKVNATAVAPANGQSRSIEFLDDGTNFVEQWRGAVDVPN